MTRAEVIEAYEEVRAACNVAESLYEAHAELMRAAQRMQKRADACLVRAEALLDQANAAYRDLEG